jgi:hypothetical protein
VLSRSLLTFKIGYDTAVPNVSYSLLAISTWGKLEKEEMAFENVFFSFRGEVVEMSVAY